MFAHLADYTNMYAWMRIFEFPAYMEKDGSWLPTTAQEMKRVFAFIIFSGLVRLSRADRYWSLKTLYYGNWARRIIPSHKRWQALCAFLHVVHPDQEDPNDKLKKVRYVVDKVRNACKLYYQPSQQVAVDERMIKSKARFGFKQYIKNKPVRFGVKVFALCDSQNSYCYNFEVYTGKDHGAQPEVGLTRDVVVRLLSGFEHQGYEVYTDQFYTSPALLKDLSALGIDLTGTCQMNRRGIPCTLKDVKQWQKNAPRGGMRYVRKDNQVVIQWKDKRVVTVVSSRHRATDHLQVQRRKKENNVLVEFQVSKPTAVEEYNKYMGAVDVFDQHLAAFRVLRKVKKYWKSIFFDLIDVAVVNSYLLCIIWCKAHPDAPFAKKLGKRFGHLEYRELLVADLAGIEPEEDVPRCQKRRHSKPEDPQEQHLPHIVPDADKRRCSRCWEMEQRSIKSRVSCTVCKNNKGGPLFLCLQPDRNCFIAHHTEP